MASIIEQARAFQRSVEALDTQALARMAAELSRILPDLERAAEALAKRVLIMQSDGSADGTWQAYAARRSRGIANQVRAELDRIMGILAPDLEAAQTEAARQGLEAARVLVMAQLPPGVSLPGWRTVAPLRPAQSLVGAMQQGTPLRSLLDALGTETSRSVRDSLLRGLLAGSGPRQVAREITRNTDLAATRARTISRTELLRSYRTSSQSAWMENRHLVPKWRRLCAKSARSCAACLALDGKEYPTDTVMSIHPADRCAMVPVPVSFADLGLDVPEVPAPGGELGADWFARQPDAVKVAIVGRGGLELLNRGATLSDWARETTDDKWGRVLSNRPNRDIAARLGRRGQGASEAGGRVDVHALSVHL